MDLFGIIKGMREAQEAGKDMKLLDVYAKRSAADETPGAPSADDEIYEGLLTYYHDKFMNLTPQEKNSINGKVKEYKTLLQKSVYITYLLMNIQTASIC